MGGNTVDSPYPSAQVPVDDGPELAVPQPDVVQVPADFLDVGVSFEGNPTPA